jgi:PDZ domain-containing protein
MPVKGVPLWLKLLAVVSVLALVGVVLAATPSGDVATAPHAPIEISKPGLVTIGGRPIEPPNGHLYMVAVNERTVSLLERWLLAIDTSHKVTFSPAPSKVSQRVERKFDRQAVQRSKEVAAATAFTLLGQKVEYDGDGAIVTAVDPASGAQKVVQLNDRIVRIDGRPVRTSLDVSRYISKQAPGKRVTLGIRRDNRPVLVRMSTIAPRPGSGVRSRLGLGLNSASLQITLPKPVVFRTGKVLGPSAGLAFALAVYDAESPVNLLAGRYLVATGSISIDGTVLPIGGMRQKAISATERGPDGHPIADLLLVPTDNVPEAVKTVKEFCKGASKASSQCPHVVGVRSVADAVAALGLRREALAQRYAI